MDSDLSRVLGIHVGRWAGRTPPDAEVQAAVELVRRLLGPGGGIRAEGTHFVVRRVRYAGYRGEKHADLLFWARERPAAQALGLRYTWWPAEWPAGEYYRSRPEYVELPGVRTIPKVVVALWKLQGAGDIAPAERSRVWHDEGAIEKAALRVHQSARVIVDFILHKDVENLGAWRDSLASAPLQSVREAAALIDVRGPGIGKKTPFTAMGQIIDDWRATTLRQSETEFVKAATALAPVVRAAMTRDPAAYRTGRELGYDIAGWKAVYAPPGGRPDDGVIRIVSLLTRSADGEPQRALESPPERRERMELTGDWTVTAADAMALVRDSAQIVKGVAPPRPALGA